MKDEESTNEFDVESAREAAADPFDSPSRRGLGIIPSSSVDVPLSDIPLHEPTERDSLRRIPSSTATGIPSSSSAGYGPPSSVSYDSADERTIMSHLPVTAKSDPGSPTRYRHDSDSTRIGVVVPTVPPPPMAAPPSLGYSPPTAPESVDSVDSAEAYLDAPPPHTAEAPSYEALDPDIDDGIDLEDIEEVDDESEAESERDLDPPTRIAGRSGHDVAHALRAMMIEEGETANRLPDEIDELEEEALPETAAAEGLLVDPRSPMQTQSDLDDDSEALPAFSLEEPLDSEATAWPPREWGAEAPPAPPVTRLFGEEGFLASLGTPLAANDQDEPSRREPHSVGVSTARKPVSPELLRESTSVEAMPPSAPTTRRKPPPSLPSSSSRMEAAEATVVFSGPLPSMARASSPDDPDVLTSAGAAPTSPGIDLVSDIDAIVTDELNRETGITSPGVQLVTSPSVEAVDPATLDAGDETSAVLHGPVTPRAAPIASLLDDEGEESADRTVFRRADPELLAAVRQADERAEARDDAPATAPPAPTAEAARIASSPDLAVRSSMPSIDVSDFDVPAPPETHLEDEELVELEPDEIVEDDATRLHRGDGPAAGLAKPPVRPATAPPKAPTFQPPPLPTHEPAYLVQPDAEERELIEEGKFGALIAVYRQRLALDESPPRQAKLLLRIASVYESALGDANEAMSSLIDAFEMQPANADVIAAIDRVGKETGRIGELADRVRKRLLPGAPEDKKVAFLGHLVFWYERVLSRGGEVSSFVSELERHDKHHPIVLKRQAQLAAMNGDVKTQRELLVRALESTTRTEEKVVLHLALANAWAGSLEALRAYEAALTLDPRCVVALQGVKRIGKEKEQYAQVQWALERQAEVAQTETERIDALVELAEIHETKFLKRELAATLFEQVLEAEPSHPAALRGLERCYHALREWPKLSRILTARAEHTFEKSKKVELLEMAAEVHESKLADPASAIEVYRNLLVVEPKHRRALGDLARLYEKLGDWSNVSTYRARLAELAPTKRLASQELVKLGDFLNQPDRDPIAAKLQYERAVAVDPANAAGWEALQRLAAAAGDDRRVIECLEQRRNHTEIPRQRALVLVELARVHLASGDEDSARKCFEAAIRADSSNEIAAVAMLDTYTAEEQWAEAAPLCELLVNAAIRDRDGEALFVRLRLATRIAAALGDADRAMTSAIAALDARPRDPGAQADLIAVASQLTPGASRERAREPIARIAAATLEARGTAEELGAELLARLATLLREHGDLDSAAIILERARELAPADRELTKELVEVYLARNDFDRASALKVELTRSAPDDETRFELLVEIGELWGRRAEDLVKSAAYFEEARAIKPEDHWVLTTLMWLYTELGEWQHHNAVAEDLVQVQDDPDDKVKTLLAIAEVVRDKLDDRPRAADLLDEILDLDRKRLDVFEELVRVLTEAKDWERLERSYRKMIARVKDEDEPQLQFLLFQQLGLIYRDRLGDASRAYDALDAASRIRPEDAEVRKIVIELLVITDNLDNAVARLREEIDRDPQEPQLYVELYELFLRQHFFDKAWCAVNVLARLREPTPEQRRFHEDYAPMPLGNVPGQIVEQAWKSHIFHADLDPQLTALFALIAPPAARMRATTLRPDQRSGRPFTQAHSRLHDAIRGAFSDASEILAVPMPELFVAEPGATTPFPAAVSPLGGVQVASLAIDAQSSSLVFLVGKRLAELRNELLARALFPAIADLQSIYASANRVVRQEVPKDAASAGLDASLSAVLTPRERDAIRSAILRLDVTPALIKRWSHLADLSSMRAGLLLAGDVEQARLSILADPVAPGDLSADERINELYRFATSDMYSDLRGAIGVAVQA